ncbi:MAG: glutaredoxin family protein [Solirubrobacteraceae bacterium]|nr:glutaredoxin family protein [Solirubrobacteraceae bacterium]
MADQAGIDVVLYGKPGCHLCDDARAVLERVGAPFREIDITTDDDLHAAYLERIPVVTVDRAERFEYFVDEAVLRRLLGKVDRR